MDTKQVVVQELVTRYRDAGKGRVVLLLHGWGDSLTTFDELVARLGKSYRVVAIDLPGFGQTGAPPTAWGLKEYAQFTHNFLVKLKIEKPYALIGHSNGGAIAIKAIADHVVAPERLVLLASAGIRTHSLRKTATKLTAKTAKLLTVALPQNTRRHLRNKLYGTIGSDYLVVPHMQATFRRITTEDITEDAKALKIPTLLIYGQEDRATPVSYGQLLQSRIAGSKLEVITGTGHFVHHEEPGKVNNLLEEFLG